MPISLGFTFKNFYPRFGKRAFDLFLCIVLLPFVACLCPVIFYLVRKDGGPAFYHHPRVGRYGRPFNCLKFRSMTVNGDTLLADHFASHPEARLEWEEKRKLTHDPRVTSLGRFLRRTSIDELPQLWNVFKGEMSIIGPRPIVTAEIVRYRHAIACYYRLQPGITGLWQVSGRSDVNYTMRVALDETYARNLTWRKDMAILFKTIPALCTRKGAR